MTPAAIIAALESAYRPPLRILALDESFTPIDHGFDCSSTEITTGYTRLTYRQKQKMQHFESDLTGTPREGL